MVKRFSQMWYLLRHRPDTSTESGRSQDRYRRAMISSVSLVLNRICMVVMGLISIPLALKHLGDERFGIWMAILGVVQMVRLADFGLGSSLVSKLSTLREKEHREEAQANVSTVAVILAIISVAILVVYAGSSSLIDWARVLGAETDLGRAESAPTMAVVCCLVSLDFTMNIVRVTHTALQEAYINNLFQSGGIVAGLGLMLMAIFFGCGMPILVGAYMLGPVLADMLNGIHLFWWKHPYLRPSLEAFRWEMAQSLTFVGGWFLLMQVATAGILAIPRLVIAGTLGASAVAPYAVVERVYFYLTFVPGLIVAPLWPAYSEANSKGEYVWIHKALRRVLVPCLGITCLVGVIPLLFGEPGFRLLTRQPLNISRLLILTFYLYLIGYALTQIYSTFLLGVKKTPHVALSLVLQLAVLLALVFPATIVWGIEGAAIAFAGSTWATRGLLLPFLASRWVKEHITGKTSIIEGSCGNDSLCPSEMEK